ncbi:poly(ADP-ribose) glycohydrolase ARH3-like isoform X2 [Cimex lectularius]|nr:poly(ADP-ribose) glycohydrolase ARH3-like isoform X2 [Cimex lectularius]
MSKFRGCMLGALLGDCLGSPYENEESVSKVVLQKYFDKMEGPPFKAPVKKYTDDTAMTKSVAESLIQHGAFDEKDMAKRFITEYFKEPKRGYGPGVVKVFTKLKTNKLEDLWTPAKEQFEGQGSAGNGAAMRIAPVALFCHDNEDLLIDTVTKSAKLTHTHPLGINGAILQALAIKHSYNHDPKTPIDVDKFSTYLLEKMTALEDNNSMSDNEEECYKTQLEIVQKLLKVGEVCDDEVVQALGNNALAIFSVPTAIYCFLRSLRPINKIDTDNPFRRCIQYSISLGGDTDTIASMAGAISGAYHGDELINSSLKSQCEADAYVQELADNLHHVKFG